MPVIGINYTRVEAERKPGRRQKVSVKTSPAIKNARKARMLDRDVLLVEFSFESRIEPDIGHVTIEGVAIYSGDDVEEAAKQWESTKSLPPKTTQEVLNYLLAKTTIRALEIGDMLDLPPVVAMPRVTVKPEEEKNKKKKGSRKK